jgi:c-di-GMP-binding flagellar brake protein YcgR
MLRSEAEIAEIAVLEALAAEGETIVAQLDNNELLFRSRLRFVDPDRQYIVVEPHAEAVNNDALLDQTRVAFVAEVGEWRIEFIAAAPQLAVHGGTAAIRLRFPEAISSHRRRMHHRAPVSPQSPVRCAIYTEGVASFEGSILDISQGGVAVQYGQNIPLEPGMILKNCCIERPGRDTVTVDLEVRFTETVTLPNGARAQRAGCRFLNRSPASMAMIAELVNKKP